MGAPSASGEHHTNPLTQPPRHATLTGVPDPSAVLIDGPWSHRDVRAGGYRFHVAEAGSGVLQMEYASQIGNEAARFMSEANAVGLDTHWDVSRLNRGSAGQTRQINLGFMPLGSATDERLAFTADLERSQARAIVAVIDVP